MMKKVIWACQKCLDFRILRATTLLPKELCLKSLALRDWESKTQLPIPKLLNMTLILGVKVQIVTAVEVLAKILKLVE
jgi:hypothetical protein